MQTFYRNYDAAIGRWIAVDPTPESAESMSTYQYAVDNPVMLNDPLGNVSQANWNFLVSQLSNGLHDNYDVSDSDNKILWLTDSQAFQAGASYLSQFDAWGQSGFARSYHKAAGTYNKTVALGQWVDTGSMSGLIQGVLWCRNSDGSPTTEDGNSASIVYVDLGRRRAPPTYQQDESLLSGLWNSPLARAIIPDEIGLNLTVSDVVGVGFNVSVKAIFLTRGKDAGKGNVLLSGSVRAGFDIGVSATEERGWYYGDARNATMAGLLGSGKDLSAGVGPVAGGIWESTDSPGTTTWFGTEGGAGLKSPFAFGVSAGDSATVTLPQFGQILSKYVLQ